MSRKKSKYIADPFLVYKNQTRRVIKELYGHNAQKCKIMMDKFSECENIAQIDNLLRWGRLNLL